MFRDNREKERREKKERREVDNNKLKREEPVKKEENDRERSRKCKSAQKRDKWEINKKWRKTVAASGDGGCWKMVKSCWERRGWGKREGEKLWGHQDQKTSTLEDCLGSITTGGADGR